MSAALQSDLHALVTFRLGDDGFALPVAAVREVVPIARLARPPQLPALIEGILNLRGVAVPVLRLDRLLGQADASFGLESSILIMRDQPPLGLLVSHVEAVRAADEFQVLPVAADNTFNGCLTAELASPGGSLHLLSWPDLLLEAERGRLNEFCARAQARLAEAQLAETWEA